MRVTDQDTQKPYFLDRTPELEADLVAFEKSHCPHSSLEIRQRKDGGGALHFYRQCITCGRSIGSALKKSPQLAGAPAYADNLEDHFNAARQAEREAIYQKHVRRQRDGDEGFKRKYDAYLEGPKWKATRSKVLKRANGICEGCLERNATQVHHLTYDHIFEEFIFELVAICDECHSRLHAEKNENPPAMIEAEAEITSGWRDDHTCDGCRHGSENNNRRWCFILDEYASDALAEGGGCGPAKTNFEPLK